MNILSLISPLLQQKPTHFGSRVSLLSNLLCFWPGLVPNTIANLARSTLDGVPKADIRSRPLEWREVTDIALASSEPELAQFLTGQ